MNNRNIVNLLAKIEKLNGKTLRSGLVTKLSRFGIADAEKLLNEQAWLSDDFQEEALIFLLMIKKMELQKAFDEIKDLSRSQLKAIYKGLTKEEIIGLDENKLAALMDLKEWGLTREDVNSIAHFTAAHTRALQYLMKKGDLSPTEVIEHVKTVSRDPALIILRLDVIVKARGGRLSDVIKIVNLLETHQLQFYLDNHHLLGIQEVQELTTLQLMALTNFQHVGSIKNIIRSPGWIDTIKTRSDLQNLKTLFEHGMGFVEALNSLSGLNEHQASTFVKYRFHITANSLRASPQFNSKHHEEALEILIQKGITPSAAFLQLREKTSQEANAIAERESKVCLVM
ncbi:MAG TPA: hypothetical protein VJL60_02565 [Gammaproteobacteria bacterium]|nr:hypothetical protein [Gammaproteobacteria bacterium]